MTVQKIRAILKGLSFAIAMFGCLGAAGENTTTFAAIVCGIVMVVFGAFFMRLEHLDKIDARRRQAKRKAL
uniref:Lipoprotein n=1 Tax=Siphoviridae sp. ct3q24 TaxID=2827772 RepID=A0A8S5SEE6_9CAUD|nr:MAG TPA: hypothetical protein [Siphoviridae sp. ct3q24]